MINNLKNIITDTFSDEVDLKCLNWNKVLKKSPNVLTLYLKSTVEYYVAYFEGENLSFILYENNQAVGVFPLFIYKNQVGWQIGNDGINLIKPLFINTI